MQESPTRAREAADDAYATSLIEGEYAPSDEPDEDNQEASTSNLSMRKRSVGCSQSELVEEELSRLRAKRSPYSDWRDNSLADCNKFMLKSKIYFDTLISIDENPDESVEFGCHSYILCSRSPVLEKLIYPRKSENNPKLVKSTNEQRENKIVVTDVCPEVFWEILKYLYFDGPDIRRENVLPIYAAAKKFRLSLLSEKCRQWIKENIAVDHTTVCALMDESLANKAFFLTAECVEFFDTHPPIWETEEFRLMSTEALERVYVHYLQPQNTTTTHASKE